MKKLWCILLLAIGFMSSAQPQLELFEKANSTYNDSDFPQAIRLYDSILKMDYESAELYYNLGNAHFKSNQLPLSILNYERSARLNPNDDDVKQNLKIAREATVDRFEELPKSIVKVVYLSTLQLFQPDGWGIVSLLFFGFLVLGCYLYLFTSIRRPGFITAVVSLLLGLGSLSFAYAHSSFLENNTPAVIMAPSSYVKSAPSETAEDAFILHAGTKANILDELNDWTKIRLIDGKIGWIKSADLTKI